jgi:hypothetical protein
MATRLLGLALASTLVAVGTAGAQGVTVSFRANIVSAQPTTSGSIGGSFVYEATRHVAVAVDADYISVSDWAETFSLTGSVMVAPGHDGWSGDVVPYVLGGVGYHRFSVDLGSPRLLGPIGPGVPVGDRFCAGRGMGFGPGAGSSVGGMCTGAQQTWGVGDLPEFYARRLGDLVVPASRRWPTRVFGDPAITAGGGIRIAVSDKVIVAPEARLWIVVANGHARTSGLFGATVGYRF